MRSFSSFFCALSAILFVNSTQSQTLHVAMKGNDKNPGTIEKPLATLQAARDLMRVLRSGKDASADPRVIIHEGTYDLNNSLLIGEQDGGTENHPVMWGAATGEKVSITGGKTVNGKKFITIKDQSVLSRLSNEAREKVMSINLKKEGVENFGKHQQYGHSLPVIPSTLEVFFNGEPLTLARYPNKGGIKIGKVIDPGSVPRVGDKSNRGATFVYTDPRHKVWAGQKNIWIQGTLNYGFADDYCPIASIDTVKQELKLGKPHLYGVGSGKDFQEYVAINILEELDSPGEWYLDEATGMLYLWPPSELSTASIKVSILEDPIISMEGVSNFQLQNLTVEAGRGIGIYLERCAYTLIAGCTIRNVGTAGIFMGKGAKLLDEKVLWMIMLANPCRGKSVATRTTCTTIPPGTVRQVITMVY